MGIGKYFRSEVQKRKGEKGKLHEFLINLLD